MIKKRLNQKGFTIIELMIATAVLSTILVLVTVVMVNIGSLYYKGINQAQVQNDTRSITDELSRYIQLNDQPPVGPLNGPGVTQRYCIGPVRYTFVLGVQIGKPAPGSASPTYYHVLWRDNNPTPGSCPSQIDPSNASSPDIDLTSSSLAAADPSGAELITSNSRLAQFSMTAASPSTLNVSVAHGDNDLLCNPTLVPSSCATSDAMTNRTNYIGNVLCKGGTGDQFCSTATLNTTAVKRL